jgi:diguanylate cyclase (GGDEF)-like protein
VTIEANNKATILIVDDNPANLGVLSDLLDEAGFEVWIAQRGESAIAKVKRTPPDLILLDVMMPGIDGFETCRRLQNNPECCNIPIIFMSALSDPIDKVTGLSLGAVDYITKPFEETEVLARVRLHLKLRQFAQTIERQNQELERRVLDRTNELSQTLIQLQTTQKQLLKREATLRHHVLHDSLTGLPNRNWVMNRLTQLIQAVARDPEYLYAVLFLDLDRFKIINDSLGHYAGDRLLQLVSEKLTACLRKSDRVARLGGDEFIILLESIQDRDEVIRVAERIVDRLRLPFELEQQEVFTGVSIGITLSTIGYTNPEDILKDADIAMYRAKQAGKGCYEILTASEQNHAKERLGLENDFRRAVSDRISIEFALHYQPILSLSSGELIGFEALIRWRHPTRGWIPPVNFIPVAEETGLIRHLGTWVMWEACRQLAIWHALPDCGDLVMNVNLSPVQLHHESIFEEIKAVLVEHNLLGEYLKLEITESCFLETTAWQQDCFQNLVDLGIKLCIDDFGTGYSSLSRLHEFPLDTLKIDRSFVDRLDSPEEGGEIVKTIITLAHSLNLNVVAEGVETETQCQKLRELGCDCGQGYLFARPVDSETIDLLLKGDRKNLMSIVNRLPAEVGKQTIG